jgi:hypothetical protein
MKQRAEGTAKGAERVLHAFLIHAPTYATEPGVGPVARYGGVQWFDC